MRENRPDLYLARRGARFGRGGRLDVLDGEVGRVDGVARLHRQPDVLPADRAPAVAQILPGFRRGSGWVRDVVHSAREELPLPPCPIRRSLHFGDDLIGLMIAPEPGTK